MDALDELTNDVNERYNNKIPHDFGIKMIFASQNEYVYDYISMDGQLLADKKKIQSIGWT